MPEAAFRDREGQTQEFNFVAFSRDPAYRAANRDLLARVFAHLPSPFFQVDLASGTGLVAQEMSALCEAHDKQGAIFGIDPDGYAVESATRDTPSTAHCQVTFLQGFAQEAEVLLASRIPAAGADYVSIHDAIHEIEDADRSAVVQAVHRLLRPGGLFTYNSAFTTAAMEESPMLWGKWKARAFSILHGRRDRNVKGLIVHTPEEYRQMITEAGLTIIHEARVTVQMSRTALETIACYPRFIYGVFADLVDEAAVPLADKSRALIQALDDLGINEAPRVWHELIAQKQPAA